MWYYCFMKQLSGKHVIKNPQPKRHYVNNKDFYAAIIAYQKLYAENQKTKIPDYIGACILKICERLSTKPNFFGYTYRDEMVSDGIENCIMAIRGFDPTKSTNPFAYFTQIAWNAFIRRISREKKQTYIKHKNMQNNNVFNDLAAEDVVILQLKSNEFSDDIIRNFETKIELTKSKKNSIIGIEKFVEQDETDDQK